MALKTLCLEEFMIFETQNLSELGAAAELENRGTKI
jgi:hypothetical protein